MRLVLMADVHSNLHALQAMLTLADDLSPDEIICAGDIVGYGAFPNECCSRAAGVLSVSVSGNHDRAALSKDVSRMNTYAAAAALWTSERLDEESMRFLSRLSPSSRLDAGGIGVAVFHGSPADPDEYLYEDAVTEDRLRGVECDLLVPGHTHIPFVKRFPSRLVVNPGSIGQPRDGDPRGSFAVVDTNGMTCEIVRFEYDAAAAADAILAAGLPHVLADRLLVGR
jgi:putative phosphoesterase